MSREGKDEKFSLWHTELELTMRHPDRNIREALAYIKLARRCGSKVEWGALVSSVCRRCWKQGGEASQDWGYKKKTVWFPPYKMPLWAMWYNIYIGNLNLVFFCHLEQQFAISILCHGLQNQFGLRWCRGCPRRINSAITLWRNLLS